MAIDTTPSTVATNALQAIPFSALIGGLLDACIKAQASAAKTSWEFIREVGLTIDPDTGEKKAVNVTFQYNNNGQLTTLVVPLLVIVPIPYLAINTVDIDFLANISAASSSVSETSSDTDLGVDASADAKLGVGPFSLTIHANANYSSKQHSKASQNSSYSVEYTMGVKVSGGQADMPAGLSTILNILQGSITSVSPGDTLELSPALLRFDKSQSATVQATVKNTHGILAAGTKVTLKPHGNNPFNPPVVTRGMNTSDVLDLINGNVMNRITIPYKRRYLKPLLKAAQGNQVLAQQQQTTAQTSKLADASDEFYEAITDSKGVCTFRLDLKDDVFKGTELKQGILEITADVPVAGVDGVDQSNLEVQTVPYLIIPRGPDAIQLSQSQGSKISFDKVDQSKSIIITATDSNENAIQDLDISTVVDISDAVQLFKDITVTSGIEPPPSPIKASGKTDENGQVTFNFATKSDISGKSCLNQVVHHNPFQVK